MEDLSDVLQFADTEPQEAAENINRAKLVDVPSDTYKEFKKELEPEAIEMEASSLVSKGVGEYIGDDIQKASLTRRDIASDKLSYYESYSNYFKQQVFDIPTTQRKISDITDKFFLDPESVTDHDRLTLEVLNDQQDVISVEDFGINGTWEQLPIQVTAGIGEVWRGIEDHSALVAGIVGVQATAGAIGGGTLGGPPGAVAGAGAGFVTGLGNAALAAGFLDSYKQTRNSIYNELSRVNDKGIKLSEDAKLRTSIGVGLIGGVVNGALGKFLIKRTPFLNKFLSPKKLITIINNPALRAKMEVMGNIVRSSGAGGAAALTVEMAKMIGTGLAKTEGTEEGLLEVLENIDLERLGKATLVGTATAGTISTALNVPGYKGLKNRFTDINKKVGAALGDDQTIVVRDDGTWDIETRSKTEAPVNTPEQTITNRTTVKAVKALEAQDNVAAMSKLATTTDLKKMSPAEMSLFKKSLLSIGGIDANVYLHIEDLRKFSDDPEKGEAVRPLFDKLGITTAERNGPVQIPLYKALDVVEEYPTLSEHLRMSAEAPSGLEAKNYVERRIEAEKQIQDVLKIIGVDGELTPEQQVKLQEINKPVLESEEVINEYEIYNKPTFTKAIEGVISEKEVQDFNTAFLDAQLEVTKGIRADVEREFKTKENKIVKEINQEVEELTEDLELLGNFQAKNVKHDYVLDLKKSHKRKGHSPYAIDPKHLPEDLKEILLKDPKLKKLKVFVEGGLTPDESASMLNVESGGELIKRLANAPDKTELLNKKRQRDIQLRNEIGQAFKPDKENRLIEAYNNKSRFYLRVAKKMVNGNWTKTEKIFKRVALPLPKIEELAEQARVLVSDTPIKELNINRHNVAERRSQKIATTSIFKLDVEKAIKAKESAILNNELAKHTVLAKRQIVKNDKILKKFKDPRTIKTLKDAGMLDAANEILDVFNLDPTRKGVAKQDSYNKFVELMVKAGRGDFDIPEEFNDIRNSVTDYSVKQHTGITNTLRGLLHQAKFENKLRKKFKEDEILQTIEAVVEETTRRLTKHPSFSLKRSEADINTGLDTGWEKLQRIGRTVKSLTDSLKTSALILDEEKLSGYFQDLLVNGLTDREIRSFERYDEHIQFTKKGIAEYGEKKFNQAFNDVREIQEFKGFKTLANEGFLRKSQLMDLMANMGDPGGLERIQNYKNSEGESLSLETVKSVLERELDESDARFVQKHVIDPYKAHEQISKDLHKRTTGEDVTMVKGVTFIHRGIAYPGGYYPVKTQAATDENKIKKAQVQAEKALLNISDSLGITEMRDFSDWHASKMTNQDRLKSRTGTQRPLKLDLKLGMFDGIEAIIHDEAFREIGIDLSRIYGNSEFTKSVKAVVGPERYRIMYNSTFELIAKTQEKNNAYFREQFAFFDSLVTNFKVGLSVATMAYSGSSVMIQAASIPNAALRMGKGGPTSMIKALQRIAANPDQLGDMIDLVHEVNPRVKFHKDGIDDSLIKSTTSLISRKYAINKRWKKQPLVVDILKKGQQYVNDLGMSGMSYMDDATKVATTLAAIIHFTEGKVPNFPLSKIDGLNADERHKALSKYVQQITETALTSSSPLDKTGPEKVALGKLFTNYYTDVRNAINTQFASIRKTKWAGKRGWENAKDGEYRKAAKEARNAMNENMRLFGLVSLITLYIDNLRDEENPLDNITDLRTVDDFQEKSKQVAYYMTRSVPNAMSDEALIIRDIKFATNSKRRSDYKSVSIPLLSGVSNVATAYTGLADYLEDVIEEFDVTAGSFSRTQVKGIGFTLSHGVGGIPVNGPMKLIKAFEDSELVEDIGDSLTNEAKRLNSVINDVLFLFEGKKENKNFVEDIKRVQDELLSQHKSDKEIEQLAPEDTKETIKSIESNGDWTTLNSDTGAAGIYQFTEERWNDIAIADPTLGLTEDGRVSKDPGQQEKAMDWSIHNNTKGLTTFDIPVTTSTLYGSHRFGLIDYVTIHDAKNNEKLTDIVDDMKLFTGFTTVKSVKDFISKQIEIDKK